MIKNHVTKKRNGSEKKNVKLVESYWLTNKVIRWGKHQRQDFVVWIWCGFVWLLLLFFFRLLGACVNLLQNTSTLSWYMLLLNKPNISFDTLFNVFLITSLNCMTLDEINKRMPTIENKQLSEKNLVWRQKQNQKKNKRTDHKKKFDVIFPYHFE